MIISALVRVPGDLAEENFNSGRPPTQVVHNGKVLRKCASLMIGIRFYEVRDLQRRTNVLQQQSCLANKYPLFVNQYWIPESITFIVDLTILFPTKRNTCRNFPTFAQHKQNSVIPVCRCHNTFTPQLGSVPRIRRYFSKPSPPYGCRCNKRSN